MSILFEKLGLNLLSQSERLELIEELWDSLDDPLEEFEIPEWHIEELKRRIADAEANPDDGIPFAEWKARNAPSS